jgi:hypothetical protein
LLARIRAPLERREDVADEDERADLSLSARSSMLATWGGISMMAGCAIYNQMAPVDAVVFEKRSESRGLRYPATGEVASFDGTQEVSYEDVGRTNILT